MKSPEKTTAEGKGGRSPKNRTITLTEEERAALTPCLATVHEPIGVGQILDRVIQQDLFEALPHLPSGFVDLLIADPPYNLAKSFNGRTFRQQAPEAYAEWLESWLLPLRRLLKPDASIYLCGDWLTSASIFPVLARHFIVRNRITWEREKGRGALGNWKNCSEDIWFATVGKEYRFDANAVKLKRRVVAPYRVSGEPKGWAEEGGGGFRLTGASNLWSDITVPFWSMPENTDHPTQKPEKLVAKLVLASSRPGDVVFDPFLGSGTTVAVCKKLGRRFVGVEIDREYGLLALKRLAMAGNDSAIQGYSGGVFWERNTLSQQRAQNSSGHLEQF